MNGKRMVSILLIAAISAVFVSSSAFVNIAAAQTSKIK
jgi:outer membrane lipoprotein-sorting protein